MQPGQLWRLRSTGSNREAKRKRKKGEEIKGREQGDSVCAGSSSLIPLSDIDGRPTASHALGILEIFAWGSSLSLRSTSRCLCLTVSVPAGSFHHPQPGLVLLREAFPVPGLGQLPPFSHDLIVPGASSPQSTDTVTELLVSLTSLLPPRLKHPVVRFASVLFPNA